MRSCYNFDASLIFTVGGRYKRQSADTTHTNRHIPILDYVDWDDYAKHAMNWMHIGIEIAEDAKPLMGFVHPKEAVYLLGPEDGSLSNKAKALCKYVVSIPSRQCLNLAVAGSIVMYDRRFKCGTS
jgi:tRNA G18 (ribose-2'-O)-methylase SpoU